MSHDIQQFKFSKFFSYSSRQPWLFLVLFILIILVLIGHFPPKDTVGILIQITWNLCMYKRRISISQFLIIELLVYKHDIFFLFRISLNFLSSNLQFSVYACSTCLVKFIPSCLMVYKVVNKIGFVIFIISLFVVDRNIIDFYIIIKL